MDRIKATTEAIFGFGLLPIIPCTQVFLCFLIYLAMWWLPKRPDWTPGCPRPPRLGQWRMSPSHGSCKKFWCVYAFFASTLNQFHWHLLFMLNFKGGTWSTTILKQIPSPLRLPVFSYEYCHKRYPSSWPKIWLFFESWKVHHPWEVGTQWNGGLTGLGDPSCTTRQLFNPQFLLDYSISE